MYDKDECTHMNQKQIGKFISATRRQKVMILTQRVLCLQFKLDIFTSNWKTTSSDLFHVVLFNNTSHNVYYVICEERSRMVSSMVFELQLNFESF